MMGFNLAAERPPACPMSALARQFQGHPFVRETGRLVNARIRLERISGAAWSLVTERDSAADVLLVISVSLVGDWVSRL